jgi:hypothetical protein
MLAHQELLEGQGELPHRPGGVASDQARELVPEPENAARLEPHHRHAARDIGRERIERALHLLLRLGDRADRKKSPAAAERAGGFSGRLGGKDAIARRRQHGTRRLEIFTLEIAVEGVGKQHDFRAVGRTGLAIVKDIAAPLRQLAPCGKAGDRFQQLRRAGHRVPQVEQPGKSRRERRIERKIADQPVAQRQPILLRARGLHLRSSCAPCRRPVGHSRRQALQDTHSFIVSAISGEASASGPS